MPARRPIHTAYVGAHLFHARLASHWGELALQVLKMYAPDASDLAAAVDHALDDPVYAQLRHKLEREPIEDLRIDFEDGFGTRADEDEDAAAHAAGAEVADGIATGTLPAFCGIRRKWRPWCACSTTSSRGWISQRVPLPSS